MCLAEDVVLSTCATVVPVCTGSSKEWFKHPYIYNAMITLSDLHLMGALSMLFVALERT